jgi:RHS repeat-associated protein
LSDSASQTFRLAAAAPQAHESQTWSGQKLAIMNGQSLVVAFVPLTGGSAAEYHANGIFYYRHSDHLGSSRFVSTTNRTMYSDTAYAPFGEPYAQAGVSDLSFTGMNQDTVSGLYDFPAREYSIQGRWPSPDPAGLAAVDPTNPQSWNRYAYVLNNPLRAIDPTGLECIWDDGSFDSMGDPSTGNQGGCSLAGGTWVDHSFFSDFGLPDWSGSANDGLERVVANLQAGFALVQTSSGLGGWMLVPNGGAGPIDWNLLVPQTPTLTYSQQAINAIHNTFSKFPTVCGKVGAFAAGEIAGFGGFGQVDQNGKVSGSYLIPAAPGITDNAQLTGSGPLLFVGEGAGVLYEPDLNNYGKPAAIGGYLGFSVPGTKIEAAIGTYIENPSIAGAYSCPGS